MNDLALPATLDKVKKTIKQANIGKASRIDSLPAEIFKAAWPETLNTFHNILTSILQEEIRQNDFGDAAKATKQSVANILASMCVHCREDPVFR